MQDIRESRRGALRIGVSHTRGQSILPLLLPTFSQLYPLVELTIFEGSTTVLEEDLSKGLIDVLIGFAPFTPDCAEYAPLMQEKMYLVGQERLLHQTFGAQTQQVCRAYEATRNLRLFAKFPLFFSKRATGSAPLPTACFSRYSIQPDIRLETQNVQTAFCLAAEGMGLTICPELYLYSPYTVSGTAAAPVRQKVEIFPFPIKILPIPSPSAITVSVISAKSPAILSI